MSTPSAIFTDLYQLTMAQGYFDSGRARDQATFELFYRKNPFEGGYGVLAGVPRAIDFLRSFSFSDSDIDYLQSLNLFTSDFLDHLADLQFEGQVKGILEGSVVFAYEPLLQVTAPIIQAQLIESALLNLINYPTLIATKATRVVNASQRTNTVLEFGLRRAHGIGANEGARAAIVGGCLGTSNTMAGKLYGVGVSGTQAHSWVQSFENELESFRAYARTFPENTILLVDTYDTLESGVPNAIKVAKEMEKEGNRLRGIRIDSGDLAWFAVQSSKMLDDAGLEDVKIVLSSDLDEYLIQSIVNEIRTGADTSDDVTHREQIVDKLLWGVGTKLITGDSKETSALGGVYKLVQVDNSPVIKLSENTAKTTNPGRKQLWRLKSPQGWVADVIGLEGEEEPQQGQTIHHHIDFTKDMKLDEVTTEPLHVDLMSYYSDDKSQKDLWKEASDRRRKQLEELDLSHQRFLNPHIYKVSLTDKLFNLKREFLNRY